MNTIRLSFYANILIILEIFKAAWQEKADFLRLSRNYLAPNNIKATKLSMRGSGRIGFYAEQQAVLIESSLVRFFSESFAS